MMNDGLKIMSLWHPFCLFDDVFGPSILTKPSRSQETCKRTDDGLVLSIDVPGVKASDLSVCIENRDLRISGIRDGTKISRVIRIPIDMEITSCDALLEDGVLSVAFKKAEAARSRSVQIRTS